MKNLTSMGLRHEDGRLLVLDQQALPQREIWLDVDSPEKMISVIRDLKVRGAPLIGVAAALSLASFAERGASLAQFQEAAKNLRAARPTAVNLMNAVDRILAAQTGSSHVEADKVVAAAEHLFAEDVALCEGMAKHGSEFFADGDNVLTHCNTGGLATVGIGTALGVIRRAFEQGKRLHVFVDETRPLLQGGRLTAWELEKLGIPYTLICDNMAASLMRSGRIQKAIVGADRIARNGDFANKIGTYGVAVLCKFHGIPFFTAAPRTTVDLQCPNGAGIAIEERDPREVRGVLGSFGSIEWAPSQAKVFNPSFDVTPSEFLTALVLDCGAYRGEELKNGILSQVL